MATSITSYKGYVSRQNLDIYTVPAGKLAKVFFREMGDNRVKVDNNRIYLASTDGVVFFGYTSFSGQEEHSLEFPEIEGNKLTSLRSPPFRNGFLIVPGTKIRVLFSANSHGTAILYYDFFVIEEDM